MEEKHFSVIFKSKSVLDRILSLLLIVIFSVIVILTILLVILRYIFNTGIVGGNELMEYLFVYTTVTGTAIAIGNNDHIRIGYFMEHLPPQLKKVSDFFGILCIALINVVFIFLSYKWISKVGGAESPVMRIPMRMVQASVPAGCILALVYCVFNIFKLFNNDQKEK